MKHFIVNILIFLALFLVIDRCLFYFLQAQRPGDYKLFLDAKSAFFNTQFESDILIFGDSHIADAMDTRTLEKILPVQSYNLGIYHSSPYENYWVVKMALEHINTKPELIVLGTNPVMFDKRLSRGKYTPLILENNLGLIMGSNEKIDPPLLLKSIQEKYLWEFIINQIKGKDYIPTRDATNAHHGHLQFYNQIPGTDFNDFDFSNNKSKLKQEQIEYFRKTIELIQSHNIKVILVNSPIWFPELEALKGTDGFINFTKEINTISAQYNINIFNSDYKLLQNQLQVGDFLNTQHLNYNGSKIFTTEFSNHLLNIYNN